MAKEGKTLSKRVVQVHSDPADKKSPKTWTFKDLVSKGGVTADEYSLCRTCKTGGDCKVERKFKGFERVGGVTTAIMACRDWTDKNGRA